jgi:hypothetical protein
MAKQDDKHSMAEDYLDQIKWEGEHPYRADGSNPPRPYRKYKPIYKSKSERSLSIFFATIWWIAVIMTIGYLIFQIFVDHDGKGILIGIMALIVMTIFYFMLRDTK